MSSLIPMAIGVGQQNAQNPNVGSNFSNPNGGMASYAGGKGGSGSLGSDFGKVDPLGNAITSIGGDPLNLYGNKNNPNALIFPSGNGSASGGLPSTLPTLANVGNPKIYDPGSFNGYAYLGGGPFNQMASQLAGPQYAPTPQGAQPGSGKGLPPALAGSGGGTGKGGSIGAGGGAAYAPLMTKRTPSAGLALKAR